MSDSKSPKLSRRELLKAAALTGVGLSLPAFGEAQPAPANAPSLPSQAAPEAGGESVIGMKFTPLETVRLGIVGVGGRGTSLLKEFLDVDGVRVTAVCDLVPAKTENARALCAKKKQAPPESYTKGERDFENLVKRDDVDLVLIATPWDWHVPMALAALAAGKHVAVEVPAANTIDECWALVNASEKARRHCIMLENCCYGESEMMVLNMVKAGLLGEIKHGEAAYIHDLRELLFKDEGEGLWRRVPHQKRNGNLYPTHGLGPVANYMDIHRGDRFEYLVSMSSPERGLTKWREDRVPRDSPKWKETYACGDMNTSLIKTAKGRTIILQHDTCSPRPYDRINLVSGTKGCFRDYPPRIYFDGQAGGEKWAPLKKHKDRYEHPLWKELGKRAKKGGHGGMDYVMCWRVIDCIRKGLAPDMDVYDAAAWSAPAPLSEQSVAQGSAPVPFPDFTRGRWKDSRG
jgi:Glycosyl hydrolase 109, C-terminal domain/Oxidoreductase family, NAD-binding Rossmann fold